MRKGHGVFAAVSAERRLGVAIRFALGPLELQTHLFYIEKRRDIEQIYCKCINRDHVYMYNYGEQQKLYVLTTRLT